MTSPQDNQAGDEKRIKGITCPACGSHDSIFIGNGGYLTCSWIECPEPELDAAITKKVAAAQAAVIREALTKLPPNSKTDDPDTYYLPGVKDQIKGYNQALDKCRVVLTERLREVENG